VTIRLGVLPWLGKRFDAQAKRGTNSLSRLGLLARPITKVRKAGDHYEAFPMAHWVEPARSTRAPTCWSSTTPACRITVAISHVRDELVEIVPNTNLGKMLWRQGDAFYLLAYFALKTPVTRQRPAAGP
jgi:hypothetical protein